MTGEAQSTQSDLVQIVLTRACLYGHGACADFTLKSAALVKNPTEWLGSACAVAEGRASRDGGVCVLWGTAILAMLTAENIFITPSAPDARQRAADRRQQFAHAHGDHLTLLQVWKGYSRERQGSSSGSFPRRGGPAQVTYKLLTAALCAANPCCNCRLTKRAGTSPANARRFGKAGPFSVERLKMDLPFCECCACTDQYTAKCRPSWLIAGWWSALQSPLGGKQDAEFATAGGGGSLNRWCRENFLNERNLAKVRPPLPFHCLSSTFHCHFTAFPRPSTAISLPCLDLPLSFHCLALTSTAAQYTATQYRCSARLRGTAAEHRCVVHLCTGSLFSSP